MDSQKTEQHCMVGWSFVSEKGYSDPYNDVELSVKFAGPDGEERMVPAFWAGGNTWRVRCASSMVGKHRFRTVCSDASNGDLHGKEGKVEVTLYAGENPAQPPTPEWGLLLSRNRSHMFTSPWMVLFPGIAIMFLVLGFNLLGDGLRDALDPRLRA